MTEKTQEQQEKKSKNSEADSKFSPKKDVQEKKSPSKEAVAEKRLKENVPGKEEAVAKGSSLHASKKHCMYLCDFIRNKTIDDAISDLEKVRVFKKAVPFKGEIPHRKGMMSGRYPVKAAGLFIALLKGLKGNGVVNGIDVSTARISIASASWASRPMRRGGEQGKRTNVILKLKRKEGSE